MNKSLITSLLLSALAFSSLTASTDTSVATSTQTEDYTVNDVLDSISFSVNAGYGTQYVFRGQTRSKDVVQVNLEGDYSVNADWNLYTGLFTNLSATGDYMTEVDPYIGTTYKVYDGIVLDAGLTHYRYSRNTEFFGRRHSTEIFAGACLEYFLSPAVYAYYDFNLGQTTLEGSIMHRLDLGDSVWDRLCIESQLAIGYLHANNWTRSTTGNKVKNHYLYTEAKVDAVIQINDNAKFRAGPQLSINSNGSKGLANINDSRRMQLGFETSIGMSF